MRPTLQTARGNDVRSPPKGLQRCRPFFLCGQHGHDLEGGSPLHCERSKAQLRERDRAWGGSVERSRTSRDTNRIDAACSPRPAERLRAFRRGLCDPLARPLALPRRGLRQSLRRSRPIITSQQQYRRQDERPSPKRRRMISVGDIDALRAEIIAARFYQRRKQDSNRTAALWSAGRVLATVRRQSVAESECSTAVCTHVAN
jgi:hypothetical protein